jgi:hypothetical protein
MSARGVEPSSGFSAEPAAIQMLDWEWDEDCPDCDGDDDALTAQASDDDWTYHICPIRGVGGEIVGYRVTGGDAESGERLGFLQPSGELIKPTLAQAKSAAEASYAERFNEIGGFLDDFLDNGQNDGLHIWRDGGTVFCQIDESDPDGIQIEVTLEDYGDSGGYGAVTLCFRTISGCMGDRRALVDEVRRTLGIDT